MSTPTNHRHALAQFIIARIDQLGGGLHDFSTLLAGDMGRPYEVYRKFIYAVRCGRKAIPEGRAEAAWEKRLQLTGRSLEEFRRLVQAARAYGKTDGREHLARLEAENLALRAKVKTLTAALNRERSRLTESDTELERVEARLPLPRPGSEPEVVRLDPGGQG